MILVTDTLEINTHSTRSSITDIMLYKIFIGVIGFMYLILKGINCQLFSQWAFDKPLGTSSAMDFFYGFIITNFKIKKETNAV